MPGVVVPGILFTFLATYPFLEARASGDTREHHILDRPRDVPVRTAFGVAFLTAFIIIAAAGSNDLMATHFNLSINSITWVFRILVFVAPVLAFIVTKRTCLALQRRDRELVLHGWETGRVVRFASGEYIEVHRPLTDQERWVRVQYEATAPIEIEPAANALGVARKGYKADAMRQKLSNFFYADRVEPVTPSELAAAHAHHNGEVGEADSDTDAGELEAGTRH